MFDINNVCLILQGYNFSKEQLLNDVKKYYNEDKITNIIISSYKHLIDIELYNYAKVIDNSEIGDILTEDCLEAKRPGTGICVSEWEAYLNKKLTKPILKDSLFTKGHFE